MNINQWQLRFLTRLVELGGSVDVPVGVVNEDLVGLIEADYVLEGDGGGGRTHYRITKTGRAAIQETLRE